MEVAMYGLISAHKLSLIIRILKFYFSGCVFAINLEKFVTSWILSHQNLKFLFISRNACWIFRLRGGVRQMFGGSFFEWNEILLLGKALKFGVIFQKYALKLIKIWKIIEKFEKKCKILGKFLIMGKIMNIIWAGYNGGSGGGEPPKVENFSRNLLKLVM